MAKKDSKKASGKKASVSRESRQLEKQAGEIKTLTTSLKKLRKENEKLSTRLGKLEKDDGLKKRVRAIEKENTRSSKRFESLAKELEKTKTAAAAVDLKKKSATRNGKPRRPGEESQPIITKAAERKAVDLGVDLSSVKGTGAEGRITASDVEKAGSSKSSKNRKSGGSGKSSRKKAAKK